MTDEWQISSCAELCDLNRPAAAKRGPMTSAMVRKLLARAGELAKVPFPIHPHMLRHACGYKLANETRGRYNVTLGHKNIQHTVRYTDMAPDRFKSFWRD